MKKLTYGMVGGSLTAFIGAVHRIGAGFDGIASLAAGCFSPPQNASRSAYLVPHGARIFFGVATASPETVVTRARSGSPFSTASAIAATVPTFSTTQPTSIGSAGGSGTTRPTVA